MRSTLLLALATAATAVQARKCHDIRVPVSISSRNALFNLETLQTEIQVTDFYLNLARQGGNYSDRLLEGYHDVSGDYELATTYCEPDDGPGPVLQVMTHGIGFDRSYWDLPAHFPKYSYVDRAVEDYGYSTLTWDRLGVGASSLFEDGINELQIFLEMAALKELTTRLRNGQVCGVGHAYEKIVHLGHSFGSAITYGLVNEDPDISQGIVLTGFSQVPDYMGLFALGGNFAPWAQVAGPGNKYPAGYVGASQKIGVHINFFGDADDFDEEILEYMFENGQPNTPGEILTVGAPVGAVNQYTGPSMIITGERDVPFCGGDCMATSAIDDSAPNLIAFSESMFPNASPFNATVVPKAGHGLSLGYSASGAFDQMLSFIDTHVLA